MIDQIKWQKMTFNQQMGNIASEISRAAGFKKKNDLKYMKSSLLRIIELVDLTIEDRRNTMRLKELCRFKEVLSDWYCQTSVYHVRPESLKAYALNFAMLN